MSAEFTAARSGGDLVADARTRRVLRYALGSTLGVALATGIAWDLSFLTPVLSLSFLASPAPPPSVKKGLIFVATIAVACFAGLWVYKYLIGFPVVFFLGLGLLLFRLYFVQTGGASPFLILWLLIATLVLPMLAVQSPDLAVFVVQGIIFGASSTLFVVWIAFWLVPEPPATTTDAAAAAAAPPPSRRERFERAATMTAVVLPMLWLFHLLEWTGGILILVFTGLLSMQPAFAKDFKAGKALIVGNVVGGVTAIAMFELLTIVPEFTFLILLTLLAGLFFGSRLMSTRPTASLYGMAFSTLLLVIVSTTTSTSGDATAKVYDRIFQIIVAVVYVVTAFGLIERYRRARSR